MLIGIIGWLLCGFILGFIVSRIVNLRGDDPRIGIFIAAFGGLIGGCLFSLLSDSAVTAYNFWSLVCAALLAVVVVAVWHVLRLRAPDPVPSVRRNY